MDSESLGQYITVTEGYSKPWLLVQLRLKKLQEHKDQLSPEEYLQMMQDILQDSLNLGEWWVGIEDEVF